MAYPVDEVRITQAEAQLGRTLPDAVRARLRRNNGGEIGAGGDTWQLFPVWDPSDHRHARKTANHIVTETASARDWRGFPAGAVAIAENGTGDLLIIREGADEIEL